MLFKYNNNNFYLNNNKKKNKKTISNISEDIKLGNSLELNSNLNDTKENNLTEIKNINEINSDENNFSSREEYIKFLISKFKDTEKIEIKNNTENEETVETEENIVEKKYTEKIKINTSNEVNSSNQDYDNEYLEDLKNIIQNEYDALKYYKHLYNSYNIEIIKNIIESINKNINFLDTLIRNSFNEIYIKKENYLTISSNFNKNITFAIKEENKTIFLLLKLYNKLESKILVNILFNKVYILNSLNIIYFENIK